jgi:hypothetical protein
VLDSELVDRSAEDRLDARQPDGHRDSVCNREPGQPESGEFAQPANGFGFLAPVDAEPTGSNRTAQRTATYGGRRRLCRPDMPADMDGQF